MAMNDRLPSYGDNVGSLQVTVADPLALSTQYFAEGPVMAGTQVAWRGTVENTNGFARHNAQATVSLGAPASGIPTWTNFSAESSGDCTPSEGGVYLCDFGTIPAGGTAVVDATADTQRVRPGSISDSFVVSSDESGAAD